MKAKKEILALTGVRGVAAIIVAAYHLAYLEKGDITGYVFPGYLCVDLFFCLSGFVMAMNYASWFKTPTLRSYLFFLDRRGSRVYPLYAFLLVAQILFDTFWLHARPSTIAIASNLALAQSWGLGSIDPRLGIILFGSSWSISTELVAYLVFPLLVALAIYSRRPIALASGMIAIAGYFAIERFSPGVRGPLDNLSPQTAYPVLRCLSGFVLGLLAWRVSQTNGVIQQLGYWFDAALAIAFALLLYVAGSDIAVCALFPILIIRLTASRSAIAKLLSLRPIHRLGLVSYALYLVQYSTLKLLQAPLISAFIMLGGPWSELMADIALLILDIIIATLCFNCIEDPARTLWQKATERRPVAPISTEPSAP